MAYVVTDKCIKCKYTDCASKCPVACFHEGANMLVIDPDACIDCRICVDECPIGAIVHEEEEEAKPFLQLNRIYSQTKGWPVIQDKKSPLPRADEMAKVRNKLKFFDPTPGDDHGDS